MKYFLLLCLLIISCKSENFFPGRLEKIAFGSCCHQDKRQQIFDSVVAFDPELFIFLGDNIYGDTYDMKELQRKYKKFGRHLDFQKLKKTCPIIATWDDHDYGYNDIGEEYPHKKTSQKLFLDFFDEPQNSPRRQQEGIYTSYYYGITDEKVQIILLDVRYFRTHLERISDINEQKKRNDINMGAYDPVSYEGATMLGEKQWKWLEEELQKPAKIRIIGSSTQFLSNFNGWESWSNMPKEYEKMLNLIRKTKANGVIFISGDTHWAELSKVTPENLYPIYDLTSSGLTEVWDGYGPNKNRLSHYLGENFGSIIIDWEKKDVAIHLAIHDIKGKSKLEKTIYLSELQFK